MKKKIFLISFMITVLLSMLAISVFAEDIIVSKTESEEYGTVIQLNADPGLDNAGQYVSTLKKINDSGKDTEALCILTDGVYYYVFPSSYIVWEISGGKFEIYAGTDANPGLAQAMAEFNTAMSTNYYDDYAIVGSWGGRRLNEILRFEFTSDVTWIDRDHCCMREYPNLEEVRFEHSVSLSKSNKLLYNCKKLKTVVGFENATQVTDTSMFQGCVALETIKLPTDITRIPNYMFAGCGKLVITNLSELTNLTTIGKGAFQDSQKLVFTLPDSVTTLEESAFQSAVKSGGSFTINPTSQLTTIGVNAFRDCRTLSSIYIPSTVTSIGTNAFRQTFALTSVQNFENCQITELGTDTFSYSAIKNIKLPKTLVTLGAAFHDTGSLALVYLPDSITSISDTFTGSQPANAVYIYTGKDASVFEGCARITGATVINASDYDEAKEYEGVNLVVGYSKCIAYNNGVHGEGVNDVVFKSFVEVIQKVHVCSDCGMKEVVGVIPALFECKGCSASMTGVNGIVVGFKANITAISEYEKETGKTIKYGVFAISQSNLDGNDVFDENGNIAYGAICAEVTTSLHASAFDVKVVGITDDKKDFKLAFGAYVEATKGDNTEYSYIQDDTKGDCLNGYYYVSYSDIVE